MDDATEYMQTAQALTDLAQRQRDATRAEIVAAGPFYATVTATNADGDAQLDRFPGEWMPTTTGFTPPVGGLVLCEWIGRPEDAQPIVVGPTGDQAALFAVRDEDGRATLLVDPAARTIALGGPMSGGGLMDVAATDAATSTTSTTALLGPLALAFSIPAGETHTVYVLGGMTYNSSHAGVVLQVLLGGIVAAATSQTVLSNDNHALQAVGKRVSIGPGDHALQVAYRGSGNTARTTVQRTATLFYATRRTA